MLHIFIGAAAAAFAILLIVFLVNPRCAACPDAPTPPDAPPSVATVTCAVSGTRACRAQCVDLPAACVARGCYIQCPEDQMADEACPMCEIVCPEGAACAEAPNTNCTWDCDASGGQGACEPACAYQRTSAVTRVAPAPS